MPVALTAPLLIAGVRASIQIYFAADKSLARGVRDKARFFPDALGPNEITDLEHIKIAASDRPAFKELLVSEYKEDWDKVRVQTPLIPEDDVEVIVLRLSRVLATFEGHVVEQEFDQRLARARIAQWAGGDDPDLLKPWEEFALDMGRITLEFVGTNPSVLQVGGDAERLVGSFAMSASTFLLDLDLDDDQLGRQAFGRQLLAGMARSGLQTLSSEREMIFAEVHIQALVAATAAPILAALDEAASTSDRILLERAALDLIGPISQAAFGVIAKHQEAFLGNLGPDFNPGKLQGDLAGAFLKTVATDVDLVALFRNPEEAALSAASLRLFQAFAGVIADHPELVASDGDDAQALLVAVLQNTARTVAEAEKIDNALALEILAGGLDALSANTPGLINFGSKDGTGEAWESIVERTMQYVLGGVSEAVRDGDLNKTFTRVDLIAVSRIFFDQVANTPQIISGQHTDFEDTVKAVARAMADQNNALMTSDDWLKIASTAMREAGRNPGRLFRFDPLGASPGAKFLSEMMVAAADALTMRDKRANVLFGETLRIAIETGLEAVSGQSAAGAAVLLKQGEIRNLANQISIVVAEQDDKQFFKYGAREWLALWRELLPELLNPQKVTLATVQYQDPNEAGAMKILTGKVSDGAAKRVAKALERKVA